MKRPLFALVLVAGFAAGVTGVHAAIADPKVDVSIIKTVSDAQVFPGDAFSYTVNVTSNGPSTAFNVRMTDILPAEVTFVAVGLNTPANPSLSLPGAPPVGCGEAGGVVTCEVGSLTPGQSAEITIEVVANHSAASTCLNNASAFARGFDAQQQLDFIDPDSDPTNNAASASNACATPSITVVKQATPADGTGFNFTGDLGPFSLAVPGQPSRTFENLAPGTYAITEVIPADWELAGLNCSDGSPTDTATATATVDLAAGEHVTCTFTNGASALITTMADLTVTINDSTDPVQAGDTFSYVVNLSNVGSGAASDAQVMLGLPDGVEPMSAIQGCGVTADSSAVVSPAAIQPLQAQQACTISVLVKAKSPGVYTATAEIVAGGGDPSNDTDIEFTTVTGLLLNQEVEPGPLGINPDSGNAIFVVGTQATFVIQLINTTAVDIPNLALFDVLPAGLTYLAHDGVGVYDAPSGVWTIGTLAAGASATLHIDTTVAVAGPSTNTVMALSHDAVFPSQVSVVVEGVAVLQATATTIAADFLPATGSSNLDHWLLLGWALIATGSVLLTMSSIRSRPRGLHG